MVLKRNLDILHSLTGFTRVRNILLWLLLSGTLVGFAVPRFRYLDIDGYFCARRGVALPGECYYFGHGRGKVGILLHLATILPASLLVIFQFAPIIRQRWIVIHRVNGYVVCLLALLSSVGALMIARRHFGGGLNPQVVTGTATVIFLSSLSLGIYYIKILRLDQHRAWMLRAWVSASHVISMRLLSILMKHHTGSPSNHYYDYRPCSVIDHIFSHNATLVTTLYPVCTAFYSGAAPDQHVLIAADLTSSGRPDHIAAGLNVTFGPAAWLALVVHCVAVEVYLNMTAEEGERLRRLSCQRQVEAGIANNGIESRGKGSDADYWSLGEK